MVVRTFEVDEIVQLPRMGGADMVALGTAVVTRALAAGTLPAPITRQLDAMRVDLEVLRSSVEARVQGSAPQDSRDTTNRNLDLAWAGLRWCCKGWGLMPYPENAARVEAARAIEGHIFQDGLRFLQLPFRTQWVESQARLGIVEREGLAPLIESLGATPILTAVRRAHDEFGRALGLTEVPAEPESSSLVRQAMAQLTASMRRYVLQVTAYGHSGEPDGEALADTLLQPLKTWKTRPASPSTSPDTPSEPPAATPPAPTEPPAPAE